MFRSIFWSNQLLLEGKVYEIHIIHHLFLEYVYILHSSALSITYSITKTIRH